MSDPEVIARLRAAMDAAGARPADAANVEVGAEPGDSGAAPKGLDDDPAGVPDDVDPAALSKAMAYLTRSASRRPLTVAEARDKLVAREYDDAVVDVAVARGIAMRMLDDEGFARAWVGDRGVKRGYGRRRLHRELAKRKVPEPVIDAALSQLDEVDETAQALELARQRAQRMPADLPPARVAQRLVGMLVRRGFDSGTAHQAAREATALDRDWD